MIKTFANQDTTLYLKTGAFIDSDNALVREFTEDITAKIHDKVEKAVELYYAVRDNFRYSLEELFIEPYELRASTLVKRGYGAVCEKANLLTASLRSAGIAARVHFANVRNQVATQYLKPILATDVIVFHAWVEVEIEKHWVKLFPAFDKNFCQEYHLNPLNFGIAEEKLLQQYSAAEQKIEYLQDYGSFQDFPYSLYLQELKQHYPHLFFLEESDEHNFLKSIGNFL